MKPNKTLENKFVFQDDTAARYIFFALKNDLGGLGDYQISFQDTRVFTDTYFDAPDFRLSRNSECHRYREERHGSELVFLETVKKRTLQENTYIYEKAEAGKTYLPESVGTPPDILMPVGKIRTYRMVFDLLTRDRQRIGTMHCDQSAALYADGSVNRKFYEIELHYDTPAAMTGFSNLLQNTFNLIPIRRPKLERALGVAVQEAGYHSEKIRSIILDTDFNTDNALAILSALNHPGISLKAVITVSGVTPAWEAAVSALRTVNFARRHLQQGFGIPIIACGREAPRRPAAESEKTDNISETLEQYRTDPEEEMIRKDADNVIEQVLSASDAKVTLICGGPLSNPAAWIRTPHLRELISEKVAQIIVAGGVFFEHGVRSSQTEFNIFSDPAAADEVIRFCRGETDGREIPLIFLGLDVTKTIRFRKETSEYYAESPLRVFFSNMTENPRNNTPESLPRCLFGTALAIEYVTDPGLCELEKFHLEVETRGKQTSGMTLVNRNKHFAEARKEKTWVCFKTDVEKFERNFIRHNAAKK